MRPLNGEIRNTLKNGVRDEAFYLMQGGNLGDFRFAFCAFQGQENAHGLETAGNLDKGLRICT